MLKHIFKDTFIDNIWKQGKLNRIRRKWRKSNPHNKTVINGLINTDCISVGNYSYGEINLVNFGHTRKLKIGNFVSIGQNVNFILEAEHYMQYISTYPYKVKCLEIVDEEAHAKGDIIIEDDVWIGFGAIIMSGVHIKQGEVIAAGSVVTKNVESYSVVAGCPARHIKYRFEENIRKELCDVDFSKWDRKFIEKNIDNLYKKIDSTEQIAPFMQI